MTVSTSKSIESDMEVRSNIQAQETDNDVSQSTSSSEYMEAPGNFDETSQASKESSSRQYVYVLQLCLLQFLV